MLTLVSSRGTVSSLWDGTLDFHQDIVHSPLLWVLGSASLYSLHPEWSSWILASIPRCQEGAVCSLYWSLSASHLFYFQGGGMIGKGPIIYWADAGWPKPLSIRCLITSQCIGGSHVKALMEVPSAYCYMFQSYLFLETQNRTTLYHLFPKGQWHVWDTVKVYE